MPKILETLDSWQKMLGAIVAFLVLVAATVNSINDILVAVYDLPIGEKEKINNTLFKYHWKENPVHSKQLIVESNKGKMPITIDIYNNGDIFIDYGQFTQWFPYNDTKITSDNYHFISSANAGGFFSGITYSFRASLPVEIRNTWNSDNEVVRSKVLSDGSIENKTININTGRIVNADSIDPPLIIEAPLPETYATDNDPIQVIKLPENNQQKVKIYFLSTENTPQSINQ